MATNDQKAGSFEARRRARRRVVQALYQWQMTGDSAAEIIKQFQEEQSWDQVDSDYFELLLSESIKEDEAISEGLTPFLDRPIDQVDILQRAVLQLASAELMYHPEIPYRVVIDEAINLAKRFGSAKGHTYINAVLDKAASQWRALEATEKPKADA
jgi:N utilization substance protein B